MMTIAHGSIIVQRLGRAIPLQVVNDQTYYTALVRFGFRPSVAAAAAAKLITVDMTGRN